MIIRVTGRYVVGFDRRDHVVYQDGEVVFADETIIHVGHGYAGPVDETIDAGEAIVSPGFIDLDALADIDHAILDCWPPPELARGLAWSEDYFLAGRREVFSREEEAFKRRYALVQLILNGITTIMPIAAETTKAWAETYEEFADMAAIVGELGLRAYLGPSYRAGVNVTRRDGEADVLWNEELGWEGLRRAIDFARDIDGAHGGLTRGCLLPARIETQTLDLLRASKRASDELGCPIRLHAAQGMLEHQFLRRWYGKNAIELLHELDFLGPRTLIPHARCVSGYSQIGDTGVDEVGLLADSGASVVFCPIANAHSGSMLESFDHYRARGVNIALGTDTFPPDMIRAMDYGVSQTKSVEHQRHAGQAADLYRSATLGGARALGRDDLGRLAPGAKADIAIIDLSGLRSGVVADPIRTLVYNTTGACVRTVIINGHVVMRDGVIPGVDVNDLRARARAYFAKYVESYSERDHQRRPVAELFPSSFPIVERSARRPAKEVER